MKAGSHDDDYHRIDDEQDGKYNSNHTGYKQSRDKRRKKF